MPTLDEMKLALMNKPQGAGPFYSAVDKAIQGISQPKGTGEQYLSMISKTPGVKKAELEQRGLHQLSGKMTKEQLMALAAQKAAPKVEEKVLGGRDWEVSDAIGNKKFFGSEAEAKAAAKQWRRNEWIEMESEGPIIPEEEAPGRWFLWRGSNRVSDKMFFSKSDAEDNVDEYLEKARKEIENNIQIHQSEREDATKYSEYTLPGGENYREVLLTLPIRQDAEKALRQFQNHMMNKYPRSGIMWSKEASPEELATHQQLKSEWEKENESPTYRSHHWDEPNVLAHLRMSDRQGPNGEKLLHVEEVQSDWGQEGKKKGFAGDFNQEIPAALQKTKEATKNTADVFDKLIAEGLSEQQAHVHPDFVKAYEQERAIKKAYGELTLRAKSSIPDAPFVTNTQHWMPLAMRRALHEAAHGDYNGIVITPGEEQANRYNLRKRVKRVVWHPETGTLGAERVEGGDTIKHQGVTKEKLADYIGKDAADRLLQSKPTSGWHSIEGNDLNVGGEGMKAFYDKIIPNFLNEHGKKYGVKTQLYGQPVNIHADLEGYIPREKMEIKQLHHFLVTPEMKEDIKKNKLPLYDHGGIVHMAHGGAMPTLEQLMTPPKKFVKAYKLFRVDPKHPGKLFPLFVDANTPVEKGKWYPARAGEMAGDKVKSKLGPLAYRPGWHAGDLPIATHIGGKSSNDLKRPDVRPPNQVWAEVHMPDDVDWQSEANRRGTNVQGKLIPVRAHITDQIPEGGHYRYKTNPNMTGNWLIGGAMKVHRVLSDDEVRRINQEAKVADLPRTKPLKLADYGFNGGGKVNDQMSVDAMRLALQQQALKAYHGTPHKFAPTERNPLGEFSPEKIGSGEGQQSYGYGHYLAEAPEVAKFYRQQAGIAGPMDQFLMSKKAEDALQNLAERASKKNNRLAAGVYEELLMGDFSPDILRKKISSNLYLEPEEINQSLKALKRAEKVFAANKGHLYHIELPQEHVDQMLDWDKPLSEQPHAKAILQKIGKEIALPKIHDAEGFGFAYQTLSNAVGGQKNASALLKANGIPGIKYLDQQSRDNNQGTRNFVIFPGNEHLMKIVHREKKGGIVHMAKGGSEDNPNLQEFLKHSKVRHRVYHGSGADITEFKYDPNKSLGIWFSDKPEIASEYAHIASRGGKSPSVYPLHVALKNPASEKDYVEAQDIAQAQSEKTGWHDHSARHRKIMQDKGFDGVSFGDGTYIAFHPTQIKSAIGNRGTYDINYRDITKARGGIVHKAHGGAMPTLEQMKLALRNNQIKSVGANEAPNIQPKPHIRVDYMGGPGGVDMSPMPGQQLLPQSLQQQGPQGMPQGPEDAQGMPQGPEGAPEMGASQPGMPQMSGANTNPISSGSNILSLTPQGQALSALKPQGMAGGGSAEERYGSEERESRVKNIEEEHRLPNLHMAVPKEYLPPQHKQKSVQIFRAIRGDVKDPVIRPGDWVTLNRSYAHEHGGGKSKILAMNVPADHVVWAGTDMNEYFYVPRNHQQTKAKGGLIHKDMDTIRLEMSKKSPKRAK
jgi:hypothetical protein